MKKSTESGILFFIAVLAALVLGLYLIYDFPIQLWDEGRLAVNAIEMYKNGDWLATYYNGEMDDWNTKPPFVIWLQVISMKIFGVNYFAFRLPSALAFTCLVAMVFQFVEKNLESRHYAFIVSLIVLSTGGLLGEHVVRTGDYDAVLVLMVTGYSFSFFEYLKNRKLSDLILFSLYLFLAGLTKGIAGFIPLAGISLYVLFFSKKSLKDYRIWVAGVAGLLLVLSYYFIRENHNPGYLLLINKNELWGRFFQVTEGHPGPWYYYFVAFYGEQFFPWFLLIPISFWLAFREKNSNLKSLLIYLLTLALVFVTIHSLSKTKLWWYHVPAFPFLIVAVGIALFRLTENLKYRQVILGLVFIAAFVNLWLLTGRGKVRISANAKVAQLSQPFPEKFRKSKLVTHFEYSSPVLFGIHKINHDEGTNIRFQKDQKFNIGDTVLVFSGLNEYTVVDRYKAESLYQAADISVYRILGKKEYRDISR